MFGLTKRKNKPTEVVDVTSPTLKSLQGKYFIGQTGTLAMTGLQQHAWGGLFNPAESKVDLFFDIFTITNFTGQYIHAEIWFNPKLPGPRKTSALVHPANLAIEPPPKPQTTLQYASQYNGTPVEGVNVFNRIVPPHATLISDSSKGGIIVPPGGSFVIFLKSPGPFHYESALVFSWWEERAAGDSP